MRSRFEFDYSCESENEIMVLHCIARHGGVKLEAKVIAGKLSHVFVHTSSFKLTFQALWWWCLLKIIICLWIINPYALLFRSPVHLNIERQTFALSCANKKWLAESSANSPRKSFSFDIAYQIEIRLKKLLIENLLISLISGHVCTSKWTFLIVRNCIIRSVGIIFEPVCN